MADTSGGMTIPKQTKLDNVTLEENGSGEVQIKDGGVDYSLLRTDTTKGKYVLGDVEIIKSTTNVNTGLLAYTKMKEIRINNMIESTSIRIKFTAYDRFSADSRIRIYKNGVAVGIERNPLDTTPTEWVEDLVFQNGDLIQIYGYSLNGGGVVYLTDFEITGSITPDPITFQQTIDINGFGYTKGLELQIMLE